MAGDQLNGAAAMLLSSQLPLSALIEFCRILRHNLAAGLTLRHVFRQQSERGPWSVRPVASRISQELDSGESLQDALKHESRSFPPLFLSLVPVGEQSGNLPEVLGELENYFLLQQKLRRQFIQQITWPMIQFLLAPFVIAGMIYLLAILSQGNKPWDPLGFGLTGEKGALMFLVIFFGSLGLLIGAYLVLTRTLNQKPFIETLLLRLPIVGTCLSALALSRFCLALRLTMETGMPIRQAIRLSMRATNNSAFTVREEVVRDALKEGDDLTKALSKADVFPHNFLDIMANAEEGGRVPEVMAHQAKYYDEEARRRLKTLTGFASGLVYFCIGAFLVFMIFRIYMSYIGVLNSFSS
jgi:type IV pilus assembly protein PilC